MAASRRRCARRSAATDTPVPATIPNSPMAAHSAMIGNASRPPDSASTTRPNSTGSASNTAALTIAAAPTAIAAQRSSARRVSARL